MRDETTEKKYISSVLDLFSIPNFYKGRAGHTVTDTGKHHGESASKEVSQEEI